MLVAEWIRGSGEVTPSDRTAINALKGWLFGGPGLAPSDLPSPILATRSTMEWICASHRNSNPGGPIIFRRKMEGHQDIPRGAGNEIARGQVLGGEIPALLRT